MTPEPAQKMNSLLMRELIKARVTAEKSLRSDTGGEASLCGTGGELSLAELVELVQPRDAASPASSQEAAQNAVVDSLKMLADREWVEAVEGSCPSETRWRYKQQLHTKDDSTNEVIPHASLHACADAIFNPKGPPPSEQNPSKTE
jgi:hypothetical protein